jgi:DNA-binding MarR family transcriptional regulator
MSKEAALVNKVLIRYYWVMKITLIHGYVERLSNLLRNEVRCEGGEYGLQPVQLEVLHYLAICNRYSDTLMGVTEYLGQTKGTVSQTLKVLEKKGFLAKHTDKNDKRITHLKVSSVGEQILKKLISPPLFTHACEHLSTRSKTQIIAGLKELLQAVQRSNGMRSFGVCHTCRYNRKNEDDGYFCELTKEALSQNDVQLICREYENVA